LTLRFFHHHGKATRRRSSRFDQPHKPCVALGHPRDHATGGRLCQRDRRGLRIDRRAVTHTSAQHLFLALAATAQLLAAPPSARPCRLG
jgi:hypothetical protein